MTKTKCIDLSKWNGNVDFDKVKRDGIQKVILRSSFRHTTDSCFIDNVKKARDAGLTIAAVYHFSYALNTAQASSEAKYCLEVLDSVQLDEAMIFFDLEYDSITKAANSGVQLLPVDVNAHAKVFCEYIEKRGRKAGLYMNIDFYRNYYDEDMKRRYPIWLADYSGDPDYPCLVHQYTNKGRVDGITGNVDLDYWYEEDYSDGFIYEQPNRPAKAVVDLARSWVGRKESDGSFKEIIDIYNSFSPLPRNVKMEYDWPWCACMWSALAIALGYTDIMPIEISCGLLVEKAKELGIWIERDSEVPKPGWGLLYDWDDNGVGDNTGWPDHIGTVTYVNEADGQMLITEGNYSDQVKTRAFAIDSHYIRGYIAPRYSEDAESYVEVTPESPAPLKQIVEEVIAGAWGNGETRKRLLRENGYDPEEVQKMVNAALSAPEPEKPGAAVPNIPFQEAMIAECYAQNFSKDVAGMYSVTANLNLRNGAGTSFVSMVVLPKTSMVRCYGYYTLRDKTKWLYVETIYNQVKYTGFCSISYLKKK